MTDIFVSYAREDRERVAKLVEAFEARGWSVWWDSTISAGSDYSEAIERALRGARCVVVVWSEEAVGSHWVREEAGWGRSRGTLVPVRFDEVRPPIGFRSLQTADLVGWDGGRSAQREKLLEDIAALIEGRQAEAEIEPPAGAPAATAEPSTARRKLALAAALTAVVALAAYLWLTPEPAPSPVIPGLEPQTGVAVLPFENLTGNAQLSYIGPGLAAGIVARLAELPGVNVVSRSKALSMLEGAESSPEAARALGVNLLVEGGVYTNGPGVSVDVSVSDGASSSVLWSGRFDGTRDELFGLQHDISAALERVLSLPLSDADRRRFASLVAGGPPARAFDFYLQGLERLDNSDNPRHAEFAEDLFRQAILIDSEFAVFHAALSDAIWTQHLESSPDADLAEAKAEAERALELDPHLPQAHLAFARAVRGQGQFAASIAALRPILAEHPRPAEAFRELGNSYELAGDFQAAAECYEMATTLGPENWFNWNDRGGFLALYGDFDEARESLETAARLAPPSVNWPRLNLATLKVALGDYAGAIEDFGSLGGQTADPDVASSLATAYYFLGQFDEALVLYQRAVDLDPDDHLGHRNLGDTLEAMGRDDEALVEFRMASELAARDLAKSPQSNDLASVHALYLAKIADCEAAVASAGQTQPLLADNWQDHLYLAMAFALCGQRDEALAEIEVCVGLEYPGSVLRQQAELESLWEDPEFLELTREDN